MGVVFLCIGAAKAGTSWLHRQLAGHPECYFRAIKELHYFDALELGHLPTELKKHRDLQKTLLDRLASEHHGPDVNQSRRLMDRGAWMNVLERDQEDIPAYLTYLNNGADSALVTGEMTPAYALLPEARLRAMSRMADDVRFLYLMRDPVERLWSHVRMIAARRDPDGRVTEQRCANILDRALSGGEEQITLRCDYASTIGRILAAVPGASVLIEVFEEMVHGDGLRRLCSFLGIAPIIGDPALVYPGQPLDMTFDQRQAAARWLAPQYDAAEQALGRMPESWCREG